MKLRDMTDRELDRAHESYENAVEREHCTDDDCEYDGTEDDDCDGCTSKKCTNCPIGG